MSVNSEKRPTILVVDDNEVSKSLLQEYLTEGDYQVVLASNGEEALDIMEEMLDELSLVMLDIVMPHTDGIEVLEVMNEKGWIATLPVVIVSTETTEDMKQKVYLNNVYHFISKPFDYDEVMSCVKRILA